MNDDQDKERPLWTENDQPDNLMEDIMTVVLVTAFSGMLIAILLT
jgi:hypothetical protein